jgi:hypothetical protein
MEQVCDSMGIEVALRFPGRSKFIYIIIWSDGFLVAITASVKIYSFRKTENTLLTHKQRRPTPVLRVLTKGAL